VVIYLFIVPEGVTEAFQIFLNTHQTQTSFK
jgi:hypothetical protein